MMLGVDKLLAERERQDNSVRVIMTHATLPTVAVAWSSAAASLNAASPDEVLAIIEVLQRPINFPSSLLGAVRAQLICDPGVHHAGTPISDQAEIPEPLETQFRRKQRPDK